LQDQVTVRQVRRLIRPDAPLRPQRLKRGERRTRGGGRERANRSTAGPRTAAGGGSRRGRAGVPKGPTSFEARACRAGRGLARARPGRPGARPSGSDRRRAPTGPATPSNLSRSPEARPSVGEAPQAQPRPSRRGRVPAWLRKRNRAREAPRASTSVGQSRVRCGHGTPSRRLPPVPERSRVPAPGRNAASRPRTFSGGPVTGLPLRSVQRARAGKVTGTRRGGRVSWARGGRVSARVIRHGSAGRWFPLRRRDSGSGRRALDTGRPGLRPICAARAFLPR
jgi:hypothetical protein